MIADALDKVGSNGVLSIETSNSTETFVEVQEGMEIDRGYVSPQFVTNQERLLVEFDNCRVLITDQKVRSTARAVATACSWRHLACLKGPCVQCLAATA